MKRFGKKLVTMLISATLLTASFSMNAFAADNKEKSTTSSMSQAEIKAEIVEIVKTASSTAERDQLLLDLLQNNPLQATNNASAARTASTNSVSIVETIKIDDNKHIDFFSNGNLGIQELENLGTTQMQARAINYTNTHRASYTIKNGIGGKIVETYVKGYFAYDNTNTPKAYFTDAGYSKGTLIMWECASWNEGTGTNTRDKKAYCYADAYYHWSIGAEVGGSGEVSGSVSGGITLQDCNVLLKLNCDKAGTVSASVEIED